MHGRQAKTLKKTTSNGRQVQSNISFDSLYVTTDRSTYQRSYFMFSQLITKIGEHNFVQPVTQGGYPSVGIYW